MGFPLEKLKTRFGVGKKWEYVVQARLLEAGIESELGCDGWVEGANSIKFSKEDQDLIVAGEIVVEVKSRGGTCADFLGPIDYPYETAIVDTVWGWKMKSIKPHYYVLISQNIGGMAVLPGDTSDDWVEAVFYDRYEGKRNRTYVAPIGLLRDWDWLVNELGVRINDIRNTAREGGGDTMAPREAGNEGRENRWASLFRNKPGDDTDLHRGLGIDDSDWITGNCWQG